MNALACTITPAIVAGLTIHKDLALCGVEKLQTMGQLELVELLKESNQRAIKSAKQTLMHVGQTGVALIYLKECMPHGTFMLEVSIATGISQRTANNYMAIARHYGIVSNLRGVKEALEYIRGAAADAVSFDKPSKPIHSPPPPPPLTIEAELIDPLPQNDTEPPALIVDGTKPDMLTDTEAKRLEVLEDRVEDGLAAMINNGTAMLTIMALIPRLTKDELEKLNTAVRVQWQSLTSTN